MTASYKSWKGPYGAIQICLLLLLLFFKAAGRKTRLYIHYYYCSVYGQLRGDGNYRRRSADTPRERANLLYIRSVERLASSPAWWRKTMKRSCVLNVSVVFRLQSKRSRLANSPRNASNPQLFVVGLPTSKSSAECDVVPNQALTNLSNRYYTKTLLPNFDKCKCNLYITILNEYISYTWKINLPQSQAETAAITRNIPAYCHLLTSSSAY